MITAPGGMTLADAVAVIEHDYVNSVPSSALIYAARRVLVELQGITGRDEKPQGERVDFAHDTTITRSVQDPYAPVPWEPPVWLQAGDQMLFTLDGKQAGIYHDGTLVQTYELRDGAMQPKVEETQ